VVESICPWNSRNHPGKGNYGNARFKETINNSRVTGKGLSFGTTLANHLEVGKAFVLAIRKGRGQGVFSLSYT